MDLIITEFRFFPLGSHLPGANDKVAAYCSVVLGDCLAITGIRLIRAKAGHLIVAMPSRRRWDRCKSCGRRADIGPPYCSWCGQLTGIPLVPHDEAHADIAFPITPAARERIVGQVLRAYGEYLRDGTWGREPRAVGAAGKEADHAER